MPICEGASTHVRPEGVGQVAVNGREYSCRVFQDRTILVTGSTGFLGKMLVEKMLRVQPGLRKLYPLVRAADDAAAEQRVLDDVAGKELFDVLRQEHGANFHSFVKEKVKQLYKEIDIIINGAAITNFYERYDVALASNTFGTANVCQFAKQCTKLQMLLHVSIPYVAGEQECLLLEKPLQMAEILKHDCYLDVEAERELANEIKAKHMTAHSGADNSQQLEKVAMKDLGFKRAKHFGWPNVYVFTKALGEMLLGSLRGNIPVVILRPSIITSTFQDPFPGWIEGIRTIDALIVAYCEQKLPCFMGNAIIDAIPGDMVVNAAMVAMATHYGDAGTQVVYHATSALQNPLSCHLLAESTYAYVLTNPPEKIEGRTKRYKRPLLFSRLGYFHTYMLLVYKIPLQMLYAVNILLGGLFSEKHNKLNRSFNQFMLVAKFYTPYALFKGRFDDTNLRKLWRTTGQGHGDGCMFNIDPNCFSWRQYLFNTHIPAVLKSSSMKKERQSLKERPLFL